jgi:hypothetical protein
MKVKPVTLRLRGIDGSLAMTSPKEYRQFAIEGVSAPRKRVPRVDKVIE